MKYNRLREWLSVQLTKNPGRFVLFSILLFNLVFFAVAALVISRLAPSTLSNSGFWASVFYTVTMILDAGCIQFVVADIGEGSVAIIIACLVVVLVGMVTFTGAVIGYITNYISGFIEKANSGSHKLKLFGHLVIINWNTRADEIINDLLYSGKKEKIVVLVTGDKERIEREIENRIIDTIAKERRQVLSECEGLSWFSKREYIRKNAIKNRLTVIVREGDTYSTKQLNDISLSEAKTIVILGKEINSGVCRFGHAEKQETHEKGNADIIKTLVQVAEITSQEVSADNQCIVVEADNDWTLELINKIIEQKERVGKCSIVPVSVNKVLGLILSQFSLMPELNLVYSVLFSNKGVDFYSKPVSRTTDEAAYVRAYLNEHTHSIPLSFMSGDEGEQFYYVATEEKQGDIVSKPAASDYAVKLNGDFWLSDKNIIILGHNSKTQDIMQGFNSFRTEWKKRDGSEIINIVVIDDEASLKRNDYYRAYPYVTDVIAADIYDKEKIYAAIESFTSSHEEDTSVLILSDDTVPAEECDSAALTYLIYVQDIISMKLRENPNFDTEKVDVVVELINPKNYDVVHSYSINNVIISNRYVSKMITQIGNNRRLYEFYRDILTYDTFGLENDKAYFESKEIYVKPADSFFEEMPKPCNAAEFIRAVYYASPEYNRSVALGYVSKGGKMVLFGGDQEKQPVALAKTDKIIIYSNH